MTITANIIADSISPAGIRLVTMQLRYPRFIHAEFMTHRVFSRNASSSRAIPVKKMIADLRRDPAMPVYWGSNQKGMQAGAEIQNLISVPTPSGGCKDQNCQDAWLTAMERAIQVAEGFNEAGYHKQIVNRLLEPWAHINVVVTATEWDNFFNLRAHPDAQPEIQQLALEMINATAGSQPNHLKSGDWHLPYINASDWVKIKGEHNSMETKIDVLKKVSVARCARVSYLTHDGRKTTIEEDLHLYDRLVGSTPIHASPTEHQATPDEVLDNEFDEDHGRWIQETLHGNLVGWIQNRKLIELEMNQVPS